jgi:RNA polymerase Rpb6
MIQRPPGIGAFEFVVVATLRAAQLMRGCRRRVEGDHKPTIIAQMEVAEGKVVQMPFLARPVTPTSLLPPVEDLVAVGAA